jgi:hypothetical protein
MVSGLYGAFTFALKGRIEVVAVFVMLTGAAIGAQIGTIATKYAQGYGIRLAFAVAALCCMISIVLKQYKFDAAATVVILGTIGLICLWIVKILVAGVRKELSLSKRSSVVRA